MKWGKRRDNEKKRNVKRGVHHDGTLRHGGVWCLEQVVEASNDNLDAHQDGIALARLDEVHPPVDFVGVEAKKGSPKTGTSALALGVVGRKKELADGLRVEDGADLEC